MDFLSWLEQTGVAVWIREGGSIWSYPFVLFMHTFGLATLAGLSGSIDLRILGFARQVPLGPLRRFYPILWAAFAVTAISGTALLIADATTRLTSPVFYIKMIFVALALVIMQLLKTQVLDRPGADDRDVPRNAKMLAVASLFLWIAATTAGRLMAYVGPSVV